jgi:hypothetical protein
MKLQVSFGLVNLDAAQRLEYLLVDVLFDR